MSKPATKAANSEFYLARMAATSFNDKMASREGAAEETGIDRTRLARIELGSINPYPEEVLLMSDAYDAPQLMNFYCSHVCPIGRQTVEPCEMLEFDRMMFRALGAIQDAEQISEMIIAIAKDGKVEQDEVKKMLAVMDYLQKVGAAADEMQLWIKKHMKSRKEHHRQEDTHMKIAPEQQEAVEKIKTFYTNRVNATLPSTTVEELGAFVEDMDTEVIIKVMEYALDEHKGAWSYIRGALRAYSARGIKTLADLQRANNFGDSMKARRDSAEKRVAQAVKEVAELKDKSSPSGRKKAFTNGSMTKTTT